MGNGMLSLYQEDAQRNDSSSGANSQYMNPNSYDKLNFNKPYANYGINKYSYGNVGSQYTTPIINWDQYNQLQNINTSGRAYAPWGAAL